MTALYNEIDPFAARWMEELARRDHIAPGPVDRRSIRDLRAVDVAGPGQRHFFAGIGGWSYALRLAGVADDADVWTGSCPCQPFSAAGRRGGVSDDRHLWPEWFRLIRECRPPVIFGEQVASIDGLGWLDVVFANLEGEGYAVGAADLCSAGVGAPHPRQRLFFVAYADGESGRLQLRARHEGKGTEAIGHREARGLSDASSDGRIARIGARQGAPERRRARPADDMRLGDSGCARGGRNAGAIPRAQGEGEGCEPGHVSDEPVDAGATRGFWADADWIWHRDGKRRPVEPGTFPLAHGVPGRVGRLRGYGNAINAEAAATFIRAAL